MDELPAEINIITLNCWGLKYLSNLRNERLTEIGRKLATAEPSPHIVGLQECWTQEDYRSIRRETRFILPYGKFYHSGVFGGGLVILSKWPIEESTMFRYPLNGRPTAFFRGDWFVGKGVACAKIRYGAGHKDVMEVFNTHTHPPYEKEPHDSYVCHRTAQAWEMAKLLRGAAERGHLVIGLGDFNMVPGSLPHRIVSAHAPVRDVWRVMHPDSSLGPADDAAEKARRRPIPTAEYNVRENGATSDSIYNTWRWSKKQQKLLGPGKPPATVPPDSIDRRGKRLDYIFAGTGDRDSLGGGDDGDGGWVVKRVAVGMLDRHPELGCSLSDHFSVEATLALPAAKSGTGFSATAAEKKDEYPASPNGNGATNDHDVALLNGTYLLSPRPSSAHISAAGDDDDDDNHGGQPLAAVPTEDRSLPPSTYDEILASIHRYALRERAQQRWRGAHFLASVAVAAGCLAAVWFSPRAGVAFALVLVSSLGLAAGTVDGLIALLFVNSEVRALREFEWEVMNAKGVAAGGPAPVALALEEEEERVDGW